MTDNLHLGHSRQSDCNCTTRCDVHHADCPLGNPITQEESSWEDVDWLRERLIEARTFLASVASAESQGTQEQTDWMVEQAREGLRRAGGHDFDA